VLLICLYPFSMLACIVVTANHFIFDAVCGAAALVAGDAPLSGGFVDVAFSVTCCMMLPYLVHEQRATRGQHRQAQLRVIWCP